MRSHIPHAEVGRTRISKSRKSRLTKPFPWPAEVLETRRLLSASLASVDAAAAVRMTSDVMPPSGFIAGIVYNDANGDSWRQPTETGVAGVGVYADLDNSGMFKSGDPIAFTNAQGRFAISGLAVGKPYTIRDVLPDGYRQTQTARSGIIIPASGVVYGVEIGIAPQAQFTGFSLVDADTGAVIEPLTDGQTLDLGNLPEHLNVTADTTAGPIGSVLFSLDGNSAFRLEQGEPWSLFGDHHGQFISGTFSIGNHELSASMFGTLKGTDPLGVSETIHFTTTRTGVTIFPLRIEASGGFTNDPTAGTYDATGTILIGLAQPPGTAFSPLIQLTGSFWYNDGAMYGGGVVDSAIAALSKPLFFGSFFIHDGQSATTALMQNSPATSLELAGLQFNITGMNLAAGQVQLWGSAQLPDIFGDAALPVPASDPVLIQSTGVSIAAPLPLPAAQPINLFDQIDVTPHFQAVYVSGADTLSFSGSATAALATTFSNLPVTITLNIPGTIDIANGSAGSLIHFNVSDFDLGDIKIYGITIRSGFGLQNVSFAYAPQTGLLSGNATLDCPFNITLNAAMTFDHGKLQTLSGDLKGMEAPFGPSTPLQPAIDFSGQFSVASEPVFPYLEPHIVVNLSNMQMTLGVTNISINGKQYGGPILGMAELNGNAFFDGSHLHVYGAMNALGGFVNGNTTLDVNWSSKTFSFTLNDEVLGGIVQDTTTWTVSWAKYWTIDASEQTTIGFPSSWLNGMNSWVRAAIQGITSTVEVSSGFDVHYSAGNDNSNNYIKLWATIPLPEPAPFAIPWIWYYWVANKTVWVQADFNGKLQFPGYYDLWSAP